jgi:hypothetical protein
MEKSDDTPRLDTRVLFLFPYTNKTLINMPLLAFLPLPLSVYLFQNLPVLDKLLPNVFAPPPLEQLISHYKNDG